MVLDQSYKRRQKIVCIGISEDTNYTVRCYTAGYTPAKYWTWYICPYTYCLCLSHWLPNGIRLKWGLSWGRVTFLVGFSAYFGRAACVNTVGVFHWNEWELWVFSGNSNVNIKTAFNRTLTHTLIERDLSCNSSLNKERESWATSWSARMIKQILKRDKNRNK